MSHRLASIFVFIFMITGSALILMWVFVWNKGEIIINSTPPYSVSLTGNNVFFCEENPCLISVKPGEYSAVLQKENYFDEELFIDLKRWQKSSYEVSFIYTPNNQEIPEEVFLAQRPETEFSLPEGFANLESSVSFIGSGSFIYFEKEKQNIRHWKNGEDILITQFFDITDLKTFIAHDEKTILVLVTNGGTYLVDKQKGNKQKISNQTFSTAKWGPKSRKILLEDIEQNFYIYDQKNKKFSDLSFELPLEHIFWKTDEELVYTDTSGVYFYNLSEKESQVVMESQNELTIDEIFLSEDQKKLVFRRGEEYYLLQFTD